MLVAAAVGCRLVAVADRKLGVPGVVVVGWAVISIGFPGCRHIGWGSWCLGGLLAVLKDLGARVGTVPEGKGPVMMVALGVVG